MTAELKQGGSSMNVTAENRKEYVELYAKYILDESIANQFKAFKDGFYQVGSTHILSHLCSIPRSALAMPYICIDTRN